MPNATPHRPAALLRAGTGSHPALILSAMLLCGCADRREQGAGNEGVAEPASRTAGLPFEHAGQPAMEEGVALPDILHLVNPVRDDILEWADIVFAWDGYSKFGGNFAKHNGRWYVAGGFIGNVDVYIRDELGLTHGHVVFVTSEAGAFNQTRYGAIICGKISRGEHGSWIFCYVEEKRFGGYPKGRDYFDMNNKKITWSDY